MKTSKFYISTLREAPAEAVIASHKLMLRAGITRKLGNGLYTYLPLGLRSLYKLEQIIREEWNNTAEALEFKPTVIVPGDIWKESGRWETMGAQMLKAKNRGEQDMVVSPTAEEAFTVIVRDGLSSYKQLPVNLYQINTKYRDEIRPRYGVMRGREFIMADGYTMNADDESLDESYKLYEKAYFRIFKRLGLKIIPVRADSGAMGGSGSEEFMVESPIGDDTLIICPNEKCGFAANVEKAWCASDDSVNKKGEKPSKTDLPVEMVATPNVFSIEDMEKFFDESPKMFIKALIYRVINSSLDMTGANGADKWKRVKDPAGDYYPLSYVCVLIRADLDVNEAKLAATLKASEVVLAEAEEVLEYAGAPHGFVGPITAKCPLVVDYSVVKDGEAQMHDAIAGSGKDGYHITHVEPLRDFVPYINADVRTVKEGDKCPLCGKTFYTRKGNELGHIFKLGHFVQHFPFQFPESVFSAFQEQLLNGFMETFLDKPVQMKFRLISRANALPRVVLPAPIYPIKNIRVIFLLLQCPLPWKPPYFLRILRAFRPPLPYSRFPCFLKPLSFYAFPPCFSAIQSP